MKTDKEWVEEYDSQRGDDNRTLKFGDGSFVRAIQLDAVKHGMQLAAEIAIKHYGSECIEDWINDAADNLKEV